jgi:A/G-specific adenine glycosylase
MVGDLPVKINKLKIKERHFLYSYIVCGQEVVVKQRGKGDIWEGLFDFPMEESKIRIDKDSLDSFIANEIKEFGTQIVYNPESSFKHILTHQRIFATFVKIIVAQESLSKLQCWVNAKGYRLVDFENLENLAKPRLILKFLNLEI